MLNEKQQNELIKEHRKAIECLMEINGLCSNKGELNYDAFRMEVALIINRFTS